jgi:acyl-CoA reductase-like NAD-dependent aldehyde dehydrogenase
LTTTHLGQRPHRRGLAQYLPDPAAPFGVKGSGLGRELGPEGLVAYQQLQSIYLPAANER